MNSKLFAITKQLHTGKTRIPTNQTRSADGTYSDIEIADLLENVKNMYENGPTLEIVPYIHFHELQPGDLFKMPLTYDDYYDDSESRLMYLGNGVYIDIRNPKDVLHLSEDSGKLVILLSRINDEENK